MVFSSILFIFYFLPILLLTYYLADKKYKNIVLLVFSIFFYSWGAPKFIFTIIITTFLTFYIVHWMADSKSRHKRRLLLTFAILLNFGLLFYFKYSNFFIENVNHFLSLFGGKDIQWTKLVLPLGISFFTFESITYVVDVYRGEHKPLKNFWDYQLYIILFPKLIAGPIIRYSDIADQITDRSSNETIDNRLTGFYRFVIGLSKKVLIANQMGKQADIIFALDYAHLDSFTAWIGILAYTFQIYFDFAGYSDMAIGLGKMLGFKFTENFNNPYVSQSINEFWRRWHITLGNWLRNYLFTPVSMNLRHLRGNGLALSLLITFSLCGLWHGPSWSFVLWGLYFGLIMVFETWFLHKWFKRLGKLTRVIFTFFLVVIGWVFFRVEKLPDAFHYLHRMFAFEFKPDITFKTEFWTYFAIAFFFAFFTYLKQGQKIHDSFYVGNYSNRNHVAIILPVLLLLIISISSITASGFNPFIYFRF
jgi:alginate O-acetyltransferase complex protein AlgI